MQYYLKVVAIIFMFGQCLPKSIGQSEIAIAISDSLLYQNKIAEAQSILHSKSTTRNSSFHSIDLRNQYLQLISAYQSNFNESDFFDARNIIDSILDQQNYLPASKKIYLHHFISFSSNNLLTNTELIDYCSKGLSIAQDVLPQDTLFMIHFLFEKGSAELDGQMYTEALEDLNRAELLCSSYDATNSNMLPKIFYRIGVLHQSIENGDIGLGYEYLQKSESAFLALEHPDSLFLAQVYGMLSDVAWNFRDYEKGLLYLKKYKSFSKTIDLNPNMSPLERIRLQYHFYYKEMQFYQEHQKDQALQVVKKAENTFAPYKEDAEIKLSMAAIYNMMGELYIRSAPEKSSPFYKKAIAAFNDKESSYHFQFLFNLGKSTLYSGRAQESLLYSNELVELAKNQNISSLPHFYFLQAYAYINLDEFHKALDITNKVIQLLHPGCEIDLVEHINLKTFNPPTHKAVNINLLSRMGLAFLNGLPSNADALSTANSIFQLGIMEYGKAITSTKLTHYTKTMYEQLVWGIISSQQYLREGDLSIAELIEFSENTNEKYLWTMHKSNSDPNLYFNESLLEEEKQLRSDLIKLKQQSISDSSENITQKIFDITLQLEKVDKKKRKANSSYYDFEEAEFEFDTFQAKVASNVLVLKYEFILDSLYLFKISDRTTTVQKIKTDSSFLSQLHNACLLISDPLSNQDSLNQMLDQLSVELLPTLQENVSSLVISADGILNLLPFDLLRYQDQYLIENYNIGYVDALGLYESSEQAKLVSKALVVAPSYNHAIEVDALLAVRGDEFNLAGALEEAKLLGDVLPGDLLLKEDATKSSFVNDANHYDLLHFSMHSLLNDKDPELSNLAFYDGEIDHKLYINELYGMRLNAHMAVLSACNTGIGAEDKGNGIVSLNRAFTFAGVPSVVSSLWSAPDKATKDIMLNFYDNLSQGHNKTTALRNAKMEYLKFQKTKDFKHPYYWAGFVVHGDPSPINIVRSKMFYYYYLLAGIIVLAGFVYLSFLRNRQRQIA